ncbi:unnamed protein product [Vitrella brassicaformis CCMP3155]|uniref:Uncharacterized protein n=1 Tax=Vitrella brassicaformis (strain CCMP3155) TaxID=1169540 RepID=A0A0G4F747_VITBC|nr:unnamed protein product [Vitrella brassicaformis CCMP3155]|mmetsp:Transcript_40492/g.101281  ORF Transcript_40492/g.101281 Transcript_40492/m.101281 type:complete len:153 (-) Transcript_40492:586-1044(-)|eukprot:CEM08058.1 unnamed protein product [Vitrella brassicaformis CCMP3155]
MNTESSGDQQRFVVESEFRNRIVSLAKKLNARQPLIPDSLAQHHLHRAGCRADSDMVALRLLAAAAERQLLQICRDMKDVADLRQETQRLPERSAAIATADDLTFVLREDYGESVNREGRGESRRAAGGAGAGVAHSSQERSLQRREGQLQR